MRTLSVTRIMRALLLPLSLVATGAFAGAPADAPGKLHNDAFWNRCGAPQGQPDIPQEQCAAQTRTSLAQGCINPTEADYAVSHGVMVFCLGTTIVSACPCGCFEQSTRILTVSPETGDAIWLQAKDVTAEQAVVAAGKDATLADLGFAPHAVSYTTKGAEHNPLYVVETAGGKKLAVTQNHALLLADGRMVAAKDLKLADKLVAADGSSVTIKGITRQPTNADVYNFLVSGDGKAEHLVLAEGLVVGDILWQNALAAELGEVELRR